MPEPRRAVGLEDVIRSHRIALDVNTGHRVALARHAGYARYAYNWALADFKAGLDEGQWRSERMLRPRWNAAKRGAAPWSGPMLQVVAKNAIRDLGRATDNWKNPKVRARFPRFKRRSGRQSFRLDNGPDTVRIEGRYLHAGRLGTCIRMREALRFEGRIVGAVISRTAQRWFVSVTVEDGIDVPTGYEPVGAIGVDVGIRTLAACSDAVTYPNPKAHEAALRSASAAPTRRLPAPAMPTVASPARIDVAAAWRLSPESTPGCRTFEATPTTRRARRLLLVPGLTSAQWLPKT